MKHKEFLEIAKEMLDNPESISKFEEMFLELCLRAPTEKSEKLFNALPETVDKIIKNYRLLKENEKTN